MTQKPRSPEPESRKPNLYVISRTLELEDSKQLLAKLPQLGFKDASHKSLVSPAEQRRIADFVRRRMGFPPAIPVALRYSAERGNTGGIFHDKLGRKYPVGARFICGNVKVPSRSGFADCPFDMDYPLASTTFHLRGVKVCARADKQNLPMLAYALRTEGQADQRVVMVAELSNKSLFVITSLPLDSETVRYEATEIYRGKPVNARAFVEHRHNSQLRWHWPEGDLVVTLNMDGIAVSAWLGQKRKQLTLREVRR